MIDGAHKFTAHRNERGSDVSLEMTGHTKISRILRPRGVKTPEKSGTDANMSTVTFFQSLEVYVHPASSV